MGDVWMRGFQTNFAAPNPYDTVTTGLTDLWASDRYHASASGSYLEALTLFGAITHLAPTSLGPQEQAAAELGIQPTQAAHMQ